MSNRELPLGRVGTMNEPPQKLLFDGSEAFASHIPQATDLFMSGLQWLKVIAGKEYEVRFSQWAKLMRGARGNANAMTIAQLKWLWKSITSEPHIKKILNMRLISFDKEWKEKEPVVCVPAESRFGIFKKNFRAYGAPVLSLPLDLKADAEAVIFAPLRMKPGKAWRLECCDVETILEVRPTSLGPRNVEAAAFKVDLDEVRIDKGTIYVDVKSLNHAYTKASLRLEPHRRGPGGRAYDHIALKEESGGWKTLEELRAGAEKRLWAKLLGESEQAV